MAKQSREAANRVKQAHNRAMMDARPFVAIDGEGAGRDAKGRQHYLLMRAGEAELYTGRPLSTAECLEFICGLPGGKRGPIYVGFSFGYDVTMILRDLSGVSPGKNRKGEVIASRRDQLLSKKEFGPGKSRFCYWGDYGIEYLPRNYLRVCRLEAAPIAACSGGGMTRRPIPGSARTIYETFGFFQKSFHQAITDFGIGTQAERDRILENKNMRGDFAWDEATGLADEVRRYCGTEVDYLADMMTAFRAVCLASGLRPATWSGAGKLATAALEQHQVMTSEQVAMITPARVLQLASDGYYGGRFEVTRIGLVRGDVTADTDEPGPVWEHDLNSAYPAALLKLPCLDHGRWAPASPAWLAAAPAEALWIAPLRFDHPYRGVRQNLFGLPIRKHDGRLFWPSAGNGVYWSVEVQAAASLGCEVTQFGDGWRYVQACQCVPFAWARKMYEHRLRLGKDMRGYPLKLALNSLYGKLAQRIGNPKFANLIWAGLVTAHTRAALMHAASADPAAVAMFATDALLTVRPLRGLDIGTGLGQWGATAHPSIFIMQPGLYWGEPPAPGSNKRKLKTRGAGPKFFAEIDPATGQSRIAGIERVWHEFADRSRSAERGLFDGIPPSVRLPIRIFTGLKIAQSRGKPDTAGRWDDITRQISFAWQAKRAPRGEWISDDCIWTLPPMGDAQLRSHPHRSLGQKIMDGLDFDRAELIEEQPDLVDYSPPWVGEIETEYPE